MFPHASTISYKAIGGKMDTMTKRMKKALDQVKFHIPGYYQLKSGDLSYLYDQAVEGEGLIRAISESFEFGYAMGIRCEKKRNKRRLKGNYKEKERKMRILKYAGHDIYMLSLRECRLKAGLTQKQAADALGISQRTLSRYENNINYPTLEVVDKMCKLYGVHCDNIRFVV